MREVHRSQFQLGQVPIEEIWINPKSRDDIVVYSLLVFRRMIAC